MLYWFTICMGKEFKKDEFYNQAVALFYAVQDNALKEKFKPVLDSFPEDIKEKAKKIVREIKKKYGGEIQSFDDFASHREENIDIVREIAEYPTKYSKEEAFIEFMFDLDVLAPDYLDLND